MELADIGHTFAAAVTAARVEDDEQLEDIVTDLRDDCIQALYIAEAITAELSKASGLTDEDWQGFAQQVVGKL